MTFDPALHFTLHANIDGILLETEFLECGNDHFQSEVLHLASNKNQTVHQGLHQGSV